MLNVLSEAEFASHMNMPPMLKTLIWSSDEAPVPICFQLLGQINNAESEDQAHEILIKAIVEKIAELSGTPKGSIDPKAPLFSFGLNSMQVVQLKSWTDNTLPITLSITQMNQYTTITSLAELLIEGIRSEGADDGDGAIEREKNDENEMSLIAGKLGLHGAGKKIIFEVARYADPDVVAFIFGGLESSQDVVSAIKGQVSRLSIPNEDKIQMCLVQMQYNSHDGQSFDWADNVRDAAGAIKTYMENAWKEHRDDTSTLPIIFVGHVFGALVAVEVARAMQASCGFWPAHIIAIHMCSPQFLVEEHKKGGNSAALVSVLQNPDLCNWILSLSISCIVLAFSPIAHNYQHLIIAEYCRSLADDHSRGHLRDTT